MRLLWLSKGNAVVLRSGKDAYRTAHAIVTALKKGLETTTIHPNVIQLGKIPAEKVAML